MALKYYPLTRLITNLYTNGGVLFTPDGKPYVGRYYQTYDGRSYTGINPAVGTGISLEPASAQRNPNTAASRYQASQAQTAAPTIPEESDAQLVELKPYYPIPLEGDYTRGYFTRYFAKNVSGPGYVVEISPSAYANIQDGNVSPIILTYETTSMLWQLTGPLNDKRVSQYQIIGGVYDTNKRVTEAKAKGFVGLLTFIGGDYTKFAKIN